MMCSVRGWLLAAGQALLLVTVALTPRREIDPLWGVLGMGVLVLGIVIGIWAGASLGRALTPTPVPNGSGLVTHGPFARVRHPVYLGLLIATAGWVIALGSWWTVAAWLALVALLTVKSAWEDRLLERVYGEPWRGWASSTGGIVPRLRRK